MAKRLMRTRIVNTSGYERDFSFLGDNGVKLAKDEAFEIDGDVADALSPNEREAMNIALRLGHLKLYRVPCAYDSDLKEPRILKMAFPASGTGPTGAVATIFPTGCPYKMELIDGFVRIEGAPAADEALRKVAVGPALTQLALGWLTLPGTGPSAVSVGDIKPFTSGTPTYAVLQTGDNLQVFVTGVDTGVGATGTVFVRVVPNE